MAKKMKITKKIISILMVIAMFTVYIFPVSAINQSEFDSKLNQLRSEYPNYSTWNDTFQGASQCCGFAYLMGYRVFGSIPRNWTSVYSMDNVKAGDVIQYGNADNGTGHTIFVTSVSGNSIYFVDCNGNGNYSGATYVRSCGIKWDNVTYKSTNLFGRPFSYILSSPGVESVENPLDLGTDFYALIFNKSIKKPLTVEQNGNVTIKSERTNWCADQIWKFERQSDSTYKIISTANRMCLDVNGASNQLGANIQVWQDNGSDAQRWYVYGDVNANKFILKAKCTDCVLDLYGNYSEDGTNIQTFTRHDGEAQIFDICKIEYNSFAVNLGDSFIAKIVNTKSQILLENDKNGNVRLQNGDTGVNQLWEFKRQTDGSYKIYSKFDGTCIDLYWANHDDGTNIQMCSDYPNDAQCWYLYEYGGAYSIQSKESGKVFDIENGNLNYGANLQSYTWNWTDAQIFSIDKVDSTFQYLSKNIGDSFYALIKNKTSGKPIENNNSNIILGEENFSKNQVWFFERKVDNFYKISSLFDNKVIDLTNYGNTDGTNIQMCISTDTTAQRWYIVENNGGYSFIPKCSQNGAMDLNGNSSAKGTNIQFWTFNETDAQIFSICKIDNLDLYLQKGKPTGISLNKTSLSLDKEESYNLKATITPNNATDKTITWKSSNKSVATVTSKGKVTAKSVGTATITAKTSNGKTATCKITVVEEPTSISINKGSLIVGIGETFKFSCKTNTGTSAKVTYTSNKTSVVTVDSKGNMKAKSTGTGIITATTDNGKTAKCRVTVKKAPTSISINRKNSIMGLGETFYLEGSLANDEASRVLTFSSNKPEVATVTDSGIVTAKSIGTAIVSITTYNGQKATCRVTVKNAPTSLRFNKTNITLKKGETFYLESQFNTGEYARTVIYNSPNKSIATISGSGVIMAKSKGTVKITGKTYNGKKQTCTVTVK